MEKEKVIIGSAMIFIGTLALLVTTPKEGLEIISRGSIVFIILYGCYLNYKVIYK